LGDLGLNGRKLKTKRFCEELIGSIQVNWCWSSVDRTVRRLVKLFLVFASTVNLAFGSCRDPWPYFCSFQGFYVFWNEPSSSTEGRSDYYWSHLLWRGWLTNFPSPYMRAQTHTQLPCWSFVWLSGKLFLALVILSFGPRRNHDPYYFCLTTPEKEKNSCAFVVTRMCLLTRCLATAVSSDSTIPAY
jgi:hypothetical protein